ncbi:hypothetical protein R9C00_17030 [Flammeovirgaceae bacterium SG7u.111]|nr:hypothetical protein [Flammeovirgaceae bacterium SG7u.132]WPO33405.1 hypothetical protein R9C00_17030 [Flammeovirgaceae bacterium SG7u.111]
MKKLIHYLNPTLFIILAVILFGCEDKDALQKIENLKQEVSTLSDEQQATLAELKAATKTSDSLITVVNDLTNELEKAKGIAPKGYKASSQDENDIETLVNNIHRGWESMFKTQNTNDVLQYFLPKYTTGSIRINTENIPSVQKNTYKDFEQHLKDLIAAEENISVSFGQTDFLYTEVKGQIFVTSYKFNIRVYSNDRQIHTSSIVSMLAGGKKDGTWKVGAYNWVTFNYK